MDFVRMTTVYHGLSVAFRTLGSRLTKLARNVLEPLDDEVEDENTHDKHKQKADQQKAEEDHELSFGGLQVGEKGNADIERHDNGEGVEAEQRQQGDADAQEDISDLIA